MKRFGLLILILVFAAGLQAGDLDDVRGTGVLILAHGHERDWNGQIEALASSLPFPVEVALGMAHRNAIAEGVRRLEQRGVRRIVAVPLYVSSYSSIIRASAYLLGVSADPPPELPLFNTMTHGLQDPHVGHPPGDAAPDLSPIRSAVPVLMTSALDDHPLVAEILLDRARSISVTPRRETVFLVAHGPESEADDRLWRKAMTRLADRVRAGGDFGAVEAVTVMDNAPESVRSEAAARLRAGVERASRGGSALVVPVLLSRGGIEEGLRHRLEGLSYRMSERFLLPDPRITDWVKQQVASATRRAGSPRAAR